MAEKMKAVVKTRPACGAEYVETILPGIKPDEVLLRVRATSICGTDVHIFKWDDWSRARIGEKKLPQVMGHEVAGVVVEKGRNVRGVNEGDYVSAETHIPCNRCIQCLVGQQHICANLSILGVDCNGSFASYIAVPESVCWRNDPRIPPEHASIQEPLGNALYAVLGEDNDVAGKSIVIIGDGPIALLSVGVARACGAAPIFIVGKYEFNMEIAWKMGADHMLWANRADIDRFEYVRDHTYGFGADLVVDMAGSEQALAEGFVYLRKGGRFTAFGIAPSSPAPIDYNGGIVFKGAQIHGINGRKMFDTWFRVRSLLATGRLDPSPVITHMFLLKEFEKGFEEMMTRPRRSAKVVLFPDEEEYAAARKRLGG